MARIESFKTMSDDPIDNGLCKHCNIVPGTSHPIHGYVSCEGSECDNAYMNYVCSILEEHEEHEETCDTCKYNTCKSNICDDCDGYNNYEPIGREEE